MAAGRAVVGWHAVSAPTPPPGTSPGHRRRGGHCRRIPLTADGAINVARADSEWLPTWKPLAHANPYAAPPPDPHAMAQADAALRRGLIDTGMPGAEVEAMLGEMERLLEG
jgi:hypothetical protein